MDTIGWVLIFAGVLTFRQVSKGRGITDLPTDLGDLMTAVLTNDSAKVKEVLARKESLAPPIFGSSDSAGNEPVTSSDVSASGHDQASLIVLGKQLQSQGFRVAEGPPPFGPIGSHSSTGYHYKVDPKTGVKGLALDINWPVASEEPAKMDILAPKLVAAGWRVAWRTTGHYDHLHVDTGPAGRMTL